MRQALVAKLHVVGVENGEELQAPEDFWRAQTIERSRKICERSDVLTDFGVTTAVQPQNAWSEKPIKANSCLFKEAANMTCPWWAVEYVSGLAGHGIVIPCLPQIKTSQNFFNNIPLFYKREHFHLTVAPRTNQQIGDGSLIRDIRPNYLWAIITICWLYESLLMGGWTVNPKS